MAKSLVTRLDKLHPEQTTALVFKHLLNGDQEGALRVARKLVEKGGLDLSLFRESGLLGENSTLYGEFAQSLQLEEIVGQQQARNQALVVQLRAELPQIFSPSLTSQVH